MIPPKAISDERPLFPSVLRSRRVQLVAVWLLAGALLGCALLAAQLGQNPLNDPDLAYQRPGLLDVHGTPFPAPPVTEHIPSPGSRAVVFFTRPPLLSALTEALATRPSLQERAQLVIVVSQAMATEAGAGAPLVADHDGGVAAGFRINCPRDGGPPVGYAIVDSRGQVRYHTLDPHLATQLAEVETMLGATP